MRTQAVNPLVVLSRLLAIAVAIFLGMFALDAFSGGVPPSRAVGEFVVHLIPSAIVVGVVIAAWRRPLIGAVSFFVLAALYALIAPRGRLDWIAVIAGPMTIVGLLFLWSWRTNRPATPHATPRA